MRDIARRYQPSSPDVPKHIYSLHVAAHELSKATSRASVNPPQYYETILDYAIEEELNKNIVQSGKIRDSVKCLIGKDLNNINKQWANIDDNDALVARDLLVNNLERILKRT